MTARALHMRRPRREGEGLDLRFSVCGMVAVDVTESHVEVTCRLCQRALADAVVVPVEETLGVEVPAVIGARRVDAIAHRIIARSIEGDDGEETRARFRSWEALHEQRARVLDDGSPVRSTSDPGRFGARAQSSGGAVRMPSGRDDMIEVDIALERATACVLRIGPHELAPSAQRAIYEARCEGRPLVGRIADGRKGILVTRAPLSAAQVAERLGGEWTAHHVGMVVRSVRAKAGPLLVAKGILPARAIREETDMKVPGFDLDGWKEIAALVGCSEATAKRYASDRSLPVTRLTNGRVVAKSGEVRAWVSRQATEAA